MQAAFLQEAGRGGYGGFFRGPRGGASDLYRLAVGTKYRYSCEQASCRQTQENRYTVSLHGFLLISGWVNADGFAIPETSI